LKEVRLTTSATESRSASGPSRSIAERTTPGPDTPTLSTVSGSPTPMCAPATKGLSWTALQKQTSFAQAIPPLSAVRRAASSRTSAKSATASMLIPARVDASATEEQTRSVSASAGAIESKSALSARVKPFST
jgi:hypothetical protein